MVKSLVKRIKSLALVFKNKTFDFFSFSCVAELPKVGPILPEDIDRALSNTRPSAHLHAHLYDKFNDDYGSQILK